jgi:hypothetical protein|tara:strand:+ start:665 stop:2020 length:1356 start_codon:yes stop_codon:yes gene_type:complete
MSLARTFTVTVVSTGYGNKYALDSVQQATAYLGVSGTYRFDQSDNSNSNHPLRFSTQADGGHGGGSEYTTGVTTYGIPGNAGAYTEIAVTSSTPSQLYYYCTNHSGMGAGVSVTADSWGALKWNIGSWQNQNDSGFSVTGQSATISQGTTVVGAQINAGWSHAEWGAGPWNNPGTTGYITGQQLNVSQGNITVEAELRTGWSRGSWSSAAWNQAPDTFFDITGLETDVDLTIGSGWGREEWNSGKWNEAVGFIFTGNGNVFSTTALSALNIPLNNVSVTANAPITISGRQLTTTLNNLDANGIARITISGEPLALATVDTFAVNAGGSITINTPTFEANVEVNNIQVGLASFLNIDGQGLTTSLGIVNQGTNNIIALTGEALTITANNVTIKAEGFHTITGIPITTTLGDITLDTNNFLSIVGNQANISASNLKFWDPILPTNTETWSNIH